MRAYRIWQPSNNTRTTRTQRRTNKSKARENKPQPTKESRLLMKKIRSTHPRISPSEILRQAERKLFTEKDYTDYLLNKLDRIQADLNKQITALITEIEKWTITK